MRKVFLLGMGFCFIASLAFAQGQATDTVTVKGSIIDNMCLDAHKTEDLAAFIKTHSKECVLKCEASGYAIFADGILNKFDQDSNAKIIEFLKKEDSKLDVVVAAKKAGEELSVVSIENQK